MSKATGEMTDEQWLALKAKGKPTDSEYDARYQQLLKRYNITPESVGGVSVDKNSGAATLQMDGEADKRPLKAEKVAVEEGIREKPVSKATSEKAVNTPKKRPSTMDRKTPNLKKRTVSTSEKAEKKRITLHTDQSVKKPMSLHVEQPKVTRSAKKKPTLASSRNEYQQELTAKHKKEVADIRGAKGLDQKKTAVAKKEVAVKKPSQYKAVNMATLRNEYQQELIKKRKKEMAGR